jgi:urea ABC transporter ATP-binding protein UrtD
MAELLRTEGLRKRFRGLLANDDINFSLDAGQIRCIIGPNGAGKTTFISMISGHLPPSGGTIWFKGQDVTRLPTYRRAQMGIARKFQTPSVFDRLSVYGNLELSALGKSAPVHLRKARIDEVLELTRLKGERALAASALSHGQRQWLEIGMLLANCAELLLLDEPTAGMTSEETRATGELIRTLASIHHLSVIIIEHDINFIRGLKVPVTVLHLGRVLLEGTFDEVSKNDEVRDVYLGRA